MVRHRLNRDKKFIMKILPHSAPGYISEQAKNEMLALQKCLKSQMMAKLVDSFTDEQGNTYLV